MIEVEDVALHVDVMGQGPDVVVLTGGPGCVPYLERDEIAPPDLRAWYPEPRGVGRSGGGPHTMEREIADFERIREAVGVGSWIVMGHSWGSDLAVRYAVGHPQAVSAVVGIAAEAPSAIAHGPTPKKPAKPKSPSSTSNRRSRCMRRSANRSPIGFIDPIWRRLADCEVTMHSIAAGDDIRPSWPLLRVGSRGSVGRLDSQVRGRGISAYSAVWNL